MFVVSVHGACSPPFLSLQSRWEGACLLKRGCNFKLLPENGKVASLVTSQERVGLLWAHCCLLCLLVRTLSTPTWIFYWAINLSSPLSSHLRPNTFTNCRAKTSACQTNREWNDLRAEIQKNTNTKKSVRTEKWQKKKSHDDNSGASGDLWVLQWKLKESLKTFTLAAAGLSGRALLEGLAAALPWLCLPLFCRCVVTKTRTTAITSDKGVKEKDETVFL